MRKLFYGLLIFFSLMIMGFFILDNFVLHGALTVIISAITDPGDVTASELAIEKMWGKDIFFGSITGPRQPPTEQAILNGVLTQDPSVCPTHRDFDNFRCNYELALFLTDKSLCKNVESNLPIFDPETCKATIDGILNQDPNECQKAPSRGVDICLQDVARILKDPSICEELSKSNHRCFWNLAVSMQRDDLCELSPFTQACTAIAKRDGLMCKDISEKIERSKCLYNVAILTESPDLCDGIDDNQAAHYCTVAAKQCIDNDCTFLAQRYT